MSAANEIFGLALGRAVRSTATGARSRSREASTKTSAADSRETGRAGAFDDVGLGVIVGLDAPMNMENMSSNVSTGTEADVAVGGRASESAGELDVGDSRART